MSDLEKSIRTLVESIVRDELAKHKQPANDHALTVADYANRYSIAQSTVRVAIREQRLAVIRIGRAVRIPGEARISPPVDANTARARLTLLRGSGTLK